MTTLRQIFYVSRIAEGLSDREVQHILDISRRNNRQLDVTGCLTCSGRHFAQVIEGRSDAVRALCERIRHDPRHDGFRVLSDCVIATRDHPQWTMAFVLRSDLVDRFEALIQAAEPVAGELRQIMRDLVPDTVTGSL